MDAWELTRFVGGLLILAGLSTLLARRVGAGLGWLPLWALVRAGVQLSIIALILRGVLAAPWLVVAFMALMLTTASFTSVHRLDGLWRRRSTAVAGVVAGSAVSLVLILALQLIAWEPRYIVATSGIIIGSSMSTATLAGRRFLQTAHERRDEIEGWLALGATPAQAHLDVGRLSIRESALPTLDQSKSTGLITLPGAFVGALFGGASPFEAAQFQLIVLAGIALTTIMCATVVTRLAGRTPYVPVNG